MGYNDSRSSAQGNFGVRIGGEDAGYLQSVTIPSIELESIATSVGAHNEQIKGGGNFKQGLFEATYSMSEAKTLWNWCNSVLNKEVVVHDGEVLQADQNFNITRMVGFTEAHLTEIGPDKFSAAEGKKPHNMSVKWDAQDIRFEKGSGKLGAAQNKSMKQCIASNFRLDGFPADTNFCTEFEPSKCTVSVAKESHGTSRFPVFHYSALKFSDLTLTISMRSREAWLAYVQKVIRDGMHTANEDFDCAVFFLDPSLKNELGNFDYQRCSLAKYTEPKLTANEDKVHNFTVECWTERWNGKMV